MAIHPMKTRLLFAAGLLLWTAGASFSRDQRTGLFPKLQPGQTFTYLVRCRSKKNVKTESRVVIPLAPTASQTDARGLLRIQILDLHQVGSLPTIHARAEFLAQDAGATSAKRGNQKLDTESQTAPLGPKSIEFTISPDGSADKVSGLEALTTEQQQIWQEWLARFAIAWTISAQRAKIGDKWGAEQPEQAPSLIAALSWDRDTSYVRNEPCRSAQLTPAGETSPSSGPPDVCAVLLTSARLLQKSTPKDATPESFKVRELKTMGTAKGANEIITYISLYTGLVVRATEEASQQMDVVVVKADGSNGVHYNVDAQSWSEVLLVTEAPLPH